LYRGRSLLKRESMIFNGKTHELVLNGAAYRVASASKHVALRAPSFRVHKRGASTVRTVNALARQENAQTSSPGRKGEQLDELLQRKAEPDSFGWAKLQGGSRTPTTKERRSEFVIKRKKGNPRPPKGAPHAAPGKRTRQRQRDLALAQPASGPVSQEEPPCGDGAFRRSLQGMQRPMEVVEACQLAGQLSSSSCAHALRRVAQCCSRDARLTGDALGRRTLARTHCKPLVQGVLAAIPGAQSPEGGPGPSESISPSPGEAKTLSVRDAAMTLRALASLDAMQAFPDATRDLTQHAASAIAHQQTSTGAPSWEVTDLLWAMARGRYFPCVASRLAVEAWLRGGGLADGGATALWALARLDMGSRDLSEALEQWAPFPARMRSGQLVTCLWSMSVLGEVGCKNFVLMWRELANRGLTRDDLSHIYWAQLQQVYVATALAHGTAQNYDDAQLRSHAAASWHAMSEGAAQVSSYQRQVEVTLANMGVSHRREIACGGLSIDVALLALGVAVEMDGPSHAFYNMPLPLGPTRMKHAHLQAMGWRVMSIPYEEWDSLGDNFAKCGYIEERLAELGLKVTPNCSIHG